MMPTSSPEHLQTINSLALLCQYFDSIIDLDNDDLLFASSYLRGFIEVAAVEFGDDQQLLCRDLAAIISQQLAAASAELNVEDKTHVDEFWQSISPLFCY
ncbi:YfcL family protein [Thalassotalea sp. ND16A]|uniref:YfcL family protein n=1 Tax=Thalassotalea sp. ND16A TaxID=1535422 RepID=UPI0013631A29|nr:YfcL family protein [Thalassotalea sp. ND16A]